MKTSTSVKNNLKKIGKDRSKNKIRRETEENIVKYKDAGNAIVSARIKELDKEWDVSRAVSLFYATFLLLTVVLALVFSVYWLVLAIIAIVFMFTNALVGWCPTRYLLRKFGMRTKEEITYEKNALENFRSVKKESSKSQTAHA